MNFVVGHGIRSAFTTSSGRVWSSRAVSTIASQTAGRWTCAECRRGVGNAVQDHGILRRIRVVNRKDELAWKSSRRPISTSAQRFQEEKHKKPDDPPSNEPTPETSSTSALPSKTAEQRWHSSEQLSKLMDSLLARASLASQHINAYTGTDYSGIESLKKQIIAQEETVRAAHIRVDEARDKHVAAFGQQGSSQKEIVALLERKSSWTPTDLEHYMALVRSEHGNEQAVVAAKEELAAAERERELARSTLERLERKQYHEEQIWSDTIRRNSTWVTFGLMGLNILLLLAQIAIFEPYRRRRIVREVKGVLTDERTQTQTQVEREVDEVVEPAGVAIEAIEPVAADVVDTPAPTPPDVLPDEPVEVMDPPTAPQPAHPPDSWTGMWEAYRERFQDLFSERIIQLKKVDITTTALQGVATGFAAMGLLFVLFRPR